MLSTGHQHRISDVDAPVASEPNAPAGVGHQVLVMDRQRGEYEVRFHKHQEIRLLVVSACLMAPRLLGSCAVFMVAAVSTLECIVQQPFLKQSWSSMGLLLVLIAGYGMLYVVYEAMEIHYQKCTVTVSCVVICLGWFYNVPPHHIALDQVCDLWVDGDNLVIRTKADEQFVLRAVDQVEQVRLLIWTRKQQLYFFGCCHRGPPVLFNQAA